MRVLSMVLFALGICMMALLFMPAASALDPGMMAYDTGDSGGSDFIDWLLGLGAMTLFIAAAVSWGLSKGMILKFGKTGRDVFKILGVVFIIAGLVASGVFAVGTTDSASTSGTTPAAFDVIVAESTDLSYVTVDNTLNKISWAVSYNQTGNAWDVDCDQADFNTTISRMDVGLGNAIATCHLGNVALVDVAGSADEPVIDQTTNDQFQCKFTKSDASYHYEDVSILLESAESDYVAMNITLSADAFDEVTIYDSYTVPVTIAGELWTIELMVIAVA